ncbi:MAG: hypothetical protein N2A42_12340 [Luteolibacter sp.]
MPSNRRYLREASFHFPARTGLRSMYAAIVRAAVPLSTAERSGTAGQRDSGTAGLKQIKHIPQSRF